MKKITITLLILLMLVAPTAVVAQEAPECEFEYTVQAGDTLAKIAGKYYGNSRAYQALVAAANAIGDDAFTDIADANAIRPGWQICVPSDGDPDTGPDAQTQDSIIGTTWQWEEFQDTAGINDITVHNPKNYTLTLNPDGTFNAQADCNMVSGNYALEGSSLTLAAGPMTMAMCPPESLSDTYVARLGEVVSAVQEGGKLFLNLMMDGGNMIFSPQAPAGPLAPESLGSLEYNTEWTASGAAKLKNGFYSEPGPPGAGFATSVRPEPQFTVYGQLNGQDAAAVVLEIMLSGTGTLYDLAVVVDQNGTAANVATANLGNRVKVNSVVIENNEVVVDMVAHGPEDHPCCPSQGVVRRYALQDNQLVQSGEELLGTVILPANLSPETLENMTYKSGWTQDGTAPLANGEYREAAAPGSTTQTVIVFDNRSIPYGPINARQSSAVFLRVDPGGSGTFYDLAVVSDVEGQPVNMAITTVGDRIKIIDHQLVGGQVEVNLLDRAAGVAMAEAPTEQYIRRYAAQGEELVVVDEQYLGSYPGAYQSELTPDKVTFDAQGPASTVEGKAVPASPYNTCCPPGPTGAPDHLVYKFDGEQRLYIIPIEEWEAQWNAAGNSNISNSADQIRTLLAEQPATPPTSLPFLPQGGSLAAQVKYLDFTTGIAMRYIGRFRQDVGPAMANDFQYLVQGITSDGKYLVSFSYPVVIDTFPSDFNTIPQEELDQVHNNGEAYRQSVINAINGLESNQFEPDLTRLDVLVSSITIAQ